MNFNFRLIQLLILHGIDFFIFPAFVFLSAPVVINLFDLETQGHFSIFLALFALGHYINFGVSNAIIQTTAFHEGKIVKDINFSLALIFTGLSSIFSLGVSTVAYFHFSNLISNETSQLGNITFLFVGMYLCIEQIDFFWSALLKAKGLIRENIKIEVITKLVFFSIASAASFYTKNLSVFFFCPLFT